MSRSLWYYEHDGQSGGPVRVSQLRQMAAKGQLLPTDRVRKEDMDRWVKARAVKGLFTVEDLPAESYSSPGGSMFDFFGAGSAPVAAAEPTPEFLPVFDFFGGTSAPAPAKGGAPAPPQESTPSRATQASAPAAEEEVPTAMPVLPQPEVEESGSFQVTVPMAAPVEPVDEVTVPLADFVSDVPTAMPASDINPPLARSAELAGLEVTMSADGTATLTGGEVELSVIKGWLMARSALPGGSAGEVYLRLRHLSAIAFRDWPGVGMVLSFHAGSEAVAVKCEGDGEAAKAFVRRVVEAGE
jgi:hypothetical protein